MGSRVRARYLCRQARPPVVSCSKPLPKTPSNNNEPSRRPCDNLEKEVSQRRTLIVPFEVKKASKGQFSRCFRDKMSRNLVQLTSSLQRLAELFENAISKRYCYAEILSQAKATMTLSRCRIVAEISLQMQQRQVSLGAGGRRG